MFSKPVEAIPDRATLKGMSYIKVVKFLEDILENHTAKIEQIFWEGDYASVTSAYHSLRNTINDKGYPIKLYVRGEELYLERDDI